VPGIVFNFSDASLKKKNIRKFHAVSAKQRRILVTYVCLPFLQIGWQCSIYLRDLFTLFRAIVAEETNNGHGISLNIVSAVQEKFQDHPHSFPRPGSSCHINKSPIIANSLARKSNEFLP